MADCLELPNGGYRSIHHLNRNFVFNTYGADISIDYSAVLFIIFPVEIKESNRIVKENIPFLIF